MPDYLKRNEYVPIGEDLEIGEQVHINHKDCPAGQDTKRRLYIKRGDEDGNDVILAYCQHCSRSGAYRKPYARSIRPKKEVTGTNELSNGTLPSDCTGDWEEWPLRGRLWLLHGGISECDGRKYGLTYSPKHDRVVLPVYNTSSGKLKGYQMRSLNEVDKPKYLTEVFEKPFYWYSGHVSDTLVIVEDILSAIRVSKYHSSIAVLSSGMSDDVYSIIGKSKYTNFIVYLDNDNAQVKKSQLKIANKLKLLGKVTVIKSDKDPKELSDTELERILNE